MGKKNICPCPNLECPNHGNCINCTSRHLRIGSLNYCAFYSILPELEEAIRVSPDSPSAQIISNRIERQTNAYRNHIQNHCLSEESLREMRIQKSEVSEH